MENNNNNNNKEITKRLISIKNKLEKGLPLLLMESAILSTMIEIDGYGGVELVNMFKNSTSIIGDNSFKNSIYYDKIMEILDIAIEGKKRVLITDSVKDTVSFTSPITVTVPSHKEETKVEIQTIPYIGMISTNDEQVIAEYKRLTEVEGYDPAEITPLECIFSENVDDDKKIKFIKSIFKLDTRFVTVEYGSQDDFYSIYDSSDGFVIKYGNENYLIVGDRNNRDEEGGKETLIFTLNENGLKEAEVSALEMVFYG